MVEEEGGKSVSLVAEVGLRAPCLNLCKIVVHLVVVDGGVEIGGLVGFLLLLRPDFDDENDAEDEDDDDDGGGNSCEDPESDPCW